MSKTHAPATVKAVLNVLRLVMARAVRRGAIPANPCDGLEASERPKGQRREMRILQREQIGALLDSAKAQHRPLGDDGSRPIRPQSAMMRSWTSCGSSTNSTT